MSAPRLGVYLGNNLALHALYAAWLKREPDQYLVFTGHKDWSDWAGSVPWIGDLYKPERKPLVWSVPLFPVGATFDDAILGKFDSRWTEAAKQILARRGHEVTITIRPGWEFNGDWYPWAAKGKELLYVKTFQRFVSKFRTVSPKFRFEWCVSLDNGGANYADPVLCYPGDPSVDIISMDCYYFTQWDPADEAQAFASKRTAKWGLDWLLSFAGTHLKPIAIGEWGVQKNCPLYVAMFSNWMRDNGVLYHHYWQSNGAYPGILSDTQSPASAAAYRAVYGATPDDRPITMDIGGERWRGRIAKEISL